LVYCWFLLTITTLHILPLFWLQGNNEPSVFTNFVRHMQADGAKAPFLPPCRSNLQKTFEMVINLPLFPIFAHCYFQKRFWTKGTIFGRNVNSGVAV
jgi:hypothetical protein